MDREARKGCLFLLALVAAIPVVFAVLAFLHSDTYRLDVLHHKYHEATSKEERDRIMHEIWKLESEITERLAKDREAQERARQLRGDRD